jgi:hypothetical protein
MTKVRFHGPIAGFSGAMGEMVFADQEKKGRTLAYMKTHYDPSQAQIDQWAHFKDSAQRAKAALADPAARAFYETIAAERDSNSYAVAFTDFLVAPHFKPLSLSEYKGRVGDPISIRAVDDIGLADVEVTLTAIDGTQIEQGKAVEAGVRTGLWAYTATAPVALGADIFIKVVGFDHAGTKAQITENPIVGAEA